MPTSRSKGKSRLFQARPSANGHAGKTARPSTDGPRPDDRRVVVITNDEAEVNRQAAEALEKAKGIYQRAGQLVRVVRDATPLRCGIRRPATARISDLPPPLLREQLSSVVRFVRYRETAEGEPQQAPASPPAWSVSAIHARGEWSGIPVLEAVVDHPVLLPDGAILARNGYDASTGLLLDVRGELPDVPARPDHRQAVACRDELLEVVCDFPFRGNVDRAAWLAALLTPLARYAHHGPAPLMLVDANVRGSGKGKLVDCIARIVTGEPMTVMTYTSDGDELRKRITAAVLQCERMILLDNLEGTFGCANLDSALTATIWKDRLLGTNSIVTAPLLMSWYATGNNVAVGADTARRICPIRLESCWERPEDRDGFRHGDLLAWVGRERSRLLGAALTILRAYLLAGCPSSGIVPWGSFEEWSRVVRGAVVWVGMDDPASGRIIMQDQADVSAASMRILLEALAAADPGRRGMTAAEIVNHARLEPTATTPWRSDLHDAIESLAGRLDSRLLGYRLRAFRQRIFGGYYLDKIGTAQHAVRWAAFRAEQFGNDGKDAHHPHSLPSPSDNQSGRKFNAYR